MSNEEIVSKYYDNLREAFNEEITNELPPHREFDCKIELEPGEDVHKVGIFPYSPKEDAAVKQFIDDNMAKGYIRISESPAAYPTLVVPKKTGDSRICNDYRKLNKITKRNAYSLPRIDQVFEALKGAKIFSKLDLKSAYNLVRIREGDEYKTAFNTKYGHFEYTVMPFGLTNAPACFQSFINSVLAEEINDCCQVYLDDIVIYSKSLEEHIGHVRRVLTKLIDNKLVAKLSKCEFHKVEIAFLGHIVGKFGLKTDPEKLAAVAKPQNIRQMQSFLGFCNYYRKFIKNFAKLAKSLYKMTSKGHTFVWTPEREEDFEAIKQALVSPPVLMYPNYDKPFFVEVDASNYAIGGVLFQHGDDGALHPVYYYSKSLSKAEINYSITEKELLAIKTAFVEWRHLLQGAKHNVTIYSDHRNLLYATKPQLLTPRQVRWQQLFAGYDFQIIHRPGKNNGKADRLSRIEGPDTIGKEMNKDSILNPHATTKQSPFLALYNYHVQASTTIAQLIHSLGTQKVVDSFAHNLENLKHVMDINRSRYLDSYDKNRSEEYPEYKIFDLVWLRKPENYQPLPFYKLGTRKFGPYKIIGIDNKKKNYRLDIRKSPFPNIYPVFHVSELEPFHRIPKSLLEPPEKEIKYILNNRYYNGKYQYLVTYKDIKQEWVDSEVVDEDPYYEDVLRAYQDYSYQQFMASVATK